MPSLSVVMKTVQQHFAAMPDRKPGDLIIREQVEPAWAQLDALGWDLADRHVILGHMLTARDFLTVQLLGSKQGIAFMRSVSAMPLAYDYLDRLSRLPHGKQTVHDMIHKPGGAELVRYMTTTKGGRELGKMVAHAPRGRNFNRQTGRIYTVDQLLARLEASYSRADTPPSP